MIDTAFGLAPAATLLPRRTVSAYCLVEEDGHHQHHYVLDGPADAPRLVVEHDFHTADSARNEATAPTVTSWYGQSMIRRHDGPNGLAEAVEAIADGASVAELTCRVESYAFPFVTARVLAALAESLPASRAANWREHQAAGYLMRLTAAQLEAEAAEQAEELARGIYRARAGALRWQAKVSLEVAKTFRSAEQF
jgi:hypothetical protein